LAVEVHKDPHKLPKKLLQKPTIESERTVIGIFHLSKYILSIELDKPKKLFDSRLS
jgi:hypothetical protein